MTLGTGLKGSIYFLSAPPATEDIDGTGTLSRWTEEDRKTEKLAEHVESFELSADGNKMLLAIAKAKDDNTPGEGGPPTWVVAPADAPIKPGDGVLNLSDLKVRVEPKAEWAQMYHEVWRIERAYFYDSNFHGTDTVADEKRFEPYVAAIALRADLNYIFQEMLGALSVGHLRGHGGRFPGEASSRRIAGRRLRDQERPLLLQEDLRRRRVQSPHQGAAGAAGVECCGRRLRTGHQQRGSDGGHRHSAAA